MIECPNCNVENRPTARFCAQCRYKFPVGEVLGGQYRVIRMLKVGGMGAVYEVESDNQRYALKEMCDRFISSKERQEALNRFLAEAMTLAKLNHPRIPKVHRHFIEKDRYYLVMDFVEGEDLTDVLARAPDGRLPERQVIEWGLQVCDVLTYLHHRSQPIIFRDMKPANLMLAPDRGIMLIDFGIARLFNPAQRSGVSLVGTPGYAAPEQYQGVAEPRSDIYGLGATLHHLATGCDPTDTSQHLFNFAPVRQYDPKLSKQFERVIGRALEMKIENRFSSIEEMHQALLAQVTPVIDPLPVISPSDASLLVLPDEGVGQSSSLSTGGAVTQLPTNTTASTMWVIAGIGVIVLTVLLILFGLDVAEQLGGSIAIIETPDTGPTDILVRMYANRDWQNTGVYVKADETIVITYVSGEWSPCASFGCPYVDAAGSANLPTDYNVIPDCSNAALVARFDHSQPFCVEASFTGHVINRSGSLQLRINDRTLDDNDGAIIIRIQVG